VSLEDFFKIAVSSAVVSGFINLCWNEYNKRREIGRESLKETKLQGHTYLDVAFQLENFAQVCHGYLYRVSSALEKRHEYHDSSFLSNLRSPDFAWNPAPNWVGLPVNFAAELRSLPTQYESSLKWISDQWEWTDIEDMYSWEEECVSYYGLEACRIAASIRKNVGAPESKVIADYVSHFECLIDARARHFAQTHTIEIYIPELRPILEQRKIALHNESKLRP
jgi:hypothetical protein